MLIWVDQETIILPKHTVKKKLETEKQRNTNELYLIRARAEQKGLKMDHK